MNMEAASILALIILVIALLILIYYYLQITNNPIYQNVHAQATGFSSRVSEDEYIMDLSDRVNDLSELIKDRVQDDEFEEDNESKSDVISTRISQFIDEQSEQLIADWDIVTHSDLDDVVERYNSIEEDLNEYKTDNNTRIEKIEDDITDLKERLDKIDVKLADDQETDN